MLSLCFIDYTEIDFDGDTPSRAPLGGSQSALCYLAAELARLGHEVTVAAATSKPGSYAGVTYMRAAHADAEFFLNRRFHVVTVVNTAAKSSLRTDLPPDTRLMLWTGHAVDQPAMQGLSDPDIRRRLDRVICVSGWQRKQAIKHLGVSEEQAAVLRNAIAPPFENLFESREALREAKTGPLRLAYTSTPFRGLEILLDVFPYFRARRPSATLDVYSSMAVYQAGDDPYRSLYEKARSLPGVNYVGSLPQSALAAALAKAHILSYPNTFPETSCIAVMEALAAGLQVVTSDLGALAETTGGFARLVPMGKSRTDYVARYRKALQAPYAIESEIDRLHDQVQTINRTCTWRVRAREWTELLGRIVQSRA